MACRRAAGRFYGRLGVVSRDFPDVDRRINSLAFQSRSRIRQRYTLAGRIQKEEKIKRFAAAAISRRHEVPWADDAIDRIDGFIQEQRVGSGPGRKFAIRETGSKDPSIFTIAERLRAHDTDGRQAWSRDSGRPTVHASQGGDLRNYPAELEKRNRAGDPMYGFQFIGQISPRLAISLC